MMSNLRILNPGLQTTVQDLGRPGYQRFGIPVGGALDPVSLRAANTLVGNPPDTAALEIAYLGPTFVVEAESVRVAFFGADAAIHVLRQTSPSIKILVSTQRSIRLSRGDKVQIGSLHKAAVLYLAVQGGFDIPPVLGSVSTYVRGAIGGWKGRALAAGDQVPIICGDVEIRLERQLDWPELRARCPIRVIDGPQSDYISARDVAAFYENEYKISANSNRMGMRLDGPALTHARGFNITSDGIAPGSIQVPGDGKPIILLMDRQTTGGYPKMATVISADLPAVGRLSIGTPISFERVTMEAAYAAHCELAREIVAMPKRLSIQDDDAIDRDRSLFRSNLISGVVDAHDFAC